MRPFISLLLVGIAALAAQGLQFSVTDGRGKQTSAITLEAGAADEDGWQPVRIAKAKGDVVLLWPFDGLVKAPDRPEPIPAIVIQKGEEKALSNKAVVAALAVPVVLGVSSLSDIASKSGFPANSLSTAFGELQSATDVFQKGLGLIYAGKNAEAVDSLATALRQRQRQLTRVPSDIYPAALLYGEALYKAGKFDDAAVAFLTAQKQRPSSKFAGQRRDDALIKAGKADAVGR